MIAFVATLAGLSYLVAVRSLNRPPAPCSLGEAILRQRAPTRLR